MPKLPTPRQSPQFRRLPLDTGNTRPVEVDRQEPQVRFWEAPIRITRHSETAGFRRGGPVVRCGDDGPQPRQDGFLSLTAFAPGIGIDRLRRASRTPPWNVECVSSTTERPSDIPPLWRDDRGPPWHCRASRRWIEPLEFTIFETGDPLPQLQRVANLETPVLQAFRERPPENCSEKCRRRILKVQQASTPCFCNLLKTQGKLYRVFTGDPLIRRRWT